MTEPQSRFAGETILVSDDEEVILELTSMLLRKRGFHVLTASNGERCLQLVAEHRPSLVLLDYMMPVMNGLDALRVIAREHPETYVIMFTGKGSEEVAVELMKAGASDYIQKPFANKSLQDRIDTVLAIRQVELENRELHREREFLQREIEEWNRELEQRVLQKSRELERAHKEILQSEKLAALGHLSAGMAHEIRNPLNSINLFAQLLLATPDLDVENRGYVSKITEEVERIDTLLVQMLATSKGERGRQMPVDLVQVINQVLETSQAQIESQKITVDFQVAEDLPHKVADPLEIEQIFSNLISNALHEMPTGGTLSLILTRKEDKLQIVIQDTGKGIPQQNLSRIFDPFFTTKKKGTGFGLSVVLRIVSGYGGRISADSPTGQGACFLIELPLSADSSS